MVRPLGRLIASAALIFIAVATLVPVPQQAMAARLTPWWCLVCGDYGGMDVMNNVLLFIPLGVGLRLAGIPTRAAVGIGAMVSLSVELLQLTVVPGRDASLSDLLTNSLGSWVGALLAAYRSHLLRPSRDQAFWLAPIGGGLWLVSQLGTAILLRPWVPAEELRGMWARSVYGHPRYNGRVVSSDLSGQPLPRDSSPVSSEVIGALRSGEFALDVTLLTSAAGRWSPVVEVRGSRVAVVALLAVSGDLAFQPPMTASLLRLARPSLLIPGALVAAPGTEVHLRAGETGPTLWAQWSNHGIRHQVNLTLSPSLGWSLVTPFPYAYGREARLLTILWLASWLFLVGYWAAHLGGNSVIRGMALVLLIVCGLGLIPSILQYPAVHWSEWLGALLGLGGGAFGASVRGLF